MMNWDHPMNGWMGGWMWVPIVLSIALLILVVLGIVAIVRGMSVGPTREREDPLAIAARRLSRGEISAEEDEMIRSTLSRGPASTAVPR